jgi:hypothetical protein
VLFKLLKGVDNAMASTPQSLALLNSPLPQDCERAAFVA